MAKKKKSTTGAPIPDPPDPAETEVDLYLPTHLYNAAKNLHQAEPELYTDLVRAVFARDKLYGIEKVNIKLRVPPPAPASRKASKGKDPFKTCDPGP